MKSIHILTVMIFAAYFGTVNLALADKDGVAQSKASASRTSNEGKSTEQLYDLRSMDKIKMKTIQRSLIDKGYKVKETGEFDGATEKALQNFSHKKSFKKSGSLDSRTLKELGVQF